MSLDAAKLEKVRELAGGIVQARCPACAEGGHDRTGEHLRIYPDGRFGCCVHPKDGEHRKRIWALAGVREPGTFTLRLKTPPALPAAQSVKAALTAPKLGTLQTEWENGVPSVPGLATELNFPDSGTLGTAKVKLRARARVDSTTPNIYMVDSHEELKDSESAVLSVPPVPTLTPALSHPMGEGDEVPPSAERLPYLTAAGDLVIPFDSPERYHWWKLDGERQSVAATLAEVKERMKHAVTV